MTLTASLLLDLVLLGLLVVFFLVGYQRGLILTLCSLLAVVLSFAGGWYLATHAAEGFQAKLGPEVPGFVASSLLFLAGFLVVQIVWVTLCHALNLVAKLPGLHLLNKILGEERVIVSNIAGTTRDAIDSYFENESGKFLFIDTAGMRRKAKVDDAVEKYSNLRSIAAIERADVCLILIDANEGVTEQDTKVAGLAHEAGKACIIVVNKWDTVEKDTNTMDEKTAEVRRDLSYMTYAPVVFISALTGQRVDKLFDMIVAVSNQNSMRITTGMLNNILEDATARVQPPTDKGRRLKIYYITQVGVKPPHFGKESS